MNTNVAIILACLCVGEVTVRAQSPVEIEFVLIQAKEERVLNSLITRRSNRDGGELHREFQYLVEDGEAEIVARATLATRDGQEAVLHAGREIKFPITWEASANRDKVVPIEFGKAALGTVASVTPTINAGAGTVTLAMSFLRSEAEPRKWNTRLSKSTGAPAEIDFIPNVHSEGLQKSVVSVMDGIWSAVHWTRARVNGSTTVTVSGLGKEEKLEKPFGYTQVLFARARVKDGAAKNETETEDVPPPPATMHLVVIGVQREFVSDFLEKGILDHQALFEEAYALALRDEAFIANYVGLTTDSEMEGHGGQQSLIGDAILCDYLEPAGRVVPKATETRAVGASFSSQPYVSPDASFIQMRLSLYMVDATKARAYPVPYLGKPKVEQVFESYPEFFDRGIKARPILKNGGTILAGFGPALSIDEPPWSRWKPSPRISFTLPTLLYFVTAYAGDANALDESLPDPNEEDPERLRSIYEASPKNYLVQAVLSKPAKSDLGTHLLKSSLVPDDRLYSEMLGAWDSSLGVIAPSGNQGEVWSHRKVIWPTIYGDGGSGIIAPYGPQTATVGTHLRCEPVAGPTPPDPSERDIDLVFDLEQVSLTQMLRYPVDSSDSEKQVVFPQLHRKSVETMHTLRSGEPRLLSVQRADSRVAPKAEVDQATLVFGQVHEILTK